MQTLILILLVLLWSAVMFTGGFFICLIKFKDNEKKLNTEQMPKARDSPNELTPEQERKADRIKKELQNFMLYDGTPQEDIHIE